MCCILLHLSHTNNLLSFSSSFIFLAQVRLTTEVGPTMRPKFGPTGVRTDDLQIMTVHFMSLRRLL